MQNEFAKHVERMGEYRNTYKRLAGKPEEKNHLENLGVDRRKILKWILQK
jgi:hypothetical protein